MNDILHTIIDVLAGRRNLAAHEADAMHEALTPGYTIPLPSATDVAAAQALLARATAPAAAAPNGGQSMHDAVNQIEQQLSTPPPAPEGSAS